MYAASFSPPSAMWSVHRQMHKKRHHIASNYIFIRNRCYLCIQCFGSWLLSTCQRWFGWFSGAGCKQFVHYSLFSFSTSRTFFFTGHNLAKLSLCISQNCSPVIIFLWIAIHARIPALVWPNTGRPKMSVVALVVQHPLKILLQNLQTPLFAPPFWASDEFETEKYCQI